MVSEVKGTPPPETDALPSGGVVPGEPSETDPLATFYQMQSTRADAIASDNESSIERIRKSSDAWAKGALAIGSTAVTALGVAKLSDLLPEDSWWASTAVIVGFAIAVIALVTVATELTKVSTPLVMKTKPENMDDVDGKPVKAGYGECVEDSKRQGTPAPSERKADKSERQIIADIYRRAARLNGQRTLHDYASVATVTDATFARLLEDGMDIEEIAASLGANPPDKIRQATEFETAVIKSVEDTGLSEEAIRKLIRYAVHHPDLAAGRAAAIRAEVQAVMARAAAAVVRKRMVKATTGRRTVIALVLIPMALISAYAVGHALRTADDRSRYLADQKGCVDIASAIADKKLPYVPPICDGLNTIAPTTAAAKPPTVADARVGALGAILQRYGDCVKAAPTDQVRGCDSILLLLQRFSESP